jgi:hypothetical protein
MPHYSPLSAGHTAGSDEGIGKLKELMDICTKLTKQVAILEKDLAVTPPKMGRNGR